MLRNCLKNVYHEVFAGDTEVIMVYYQIHTVLKFL